MTEHPILFSAPMVRAILKGDKTQTRRVMKVQPQGHYWKTLPGYQLKHTEAVMANGKVAVKFRHTIPQNPSPDFENAWISCPYGVPGDLLWVRETVAHGEGLKYHVAYKADSQCGAWGWDGDGNPLFSLHGHVLEGDAGRAVGNYGMHRYGKRWTPSIHMPRWASRIRLRIRDVRVERLQDISEDDAVAEGVALERYVPVSDSAGKHASGEAEPTDPVAEYRDLWNHINGAGAWESNPWVWALSFEKVKP